ncbi:YkgJ family cysteine cluster protein [Maribellus maritimus]|uniref:YkgJ family cysteine cluster protein n=1 Tax=Maribellus maritimus TaxID=2870838 RepID=UPI001EEC5E8B|nr:YkgJ family cysteine cluster protein [Maribellus maritimus]MCG6188859.1 YkgJ family cysteine cluster protein [Maribellus maritimus]
MKKNQPFNEYLRAFYSDGYRIAINAAESIDSKEILFSAIEEMYQQIDELTVSISELSQRQNTTIDCKKGCQWCCHQPVFAMNYELDYLNFFIKTNLKTGKQKDIQARARGKAKKLKGLTNDALLNSKHPCPLLENGMCIAYKARPMACRIYLSTHLKTCLKFYNTPNDKKNFPALLEFPMQAGRMMNEGFKSALKATGFKPEEFRIEEKLLD